MKGWLAGGRGGAFSATRNKMAAFGAFGARARSAGQELAKIAGKVRPRDVLTAGCLFAGGDCIAQTASTPAGEPLDKGRVARQFAIGLGAGMQWGVWYGLLECRLRTTQWSAASKVVAGILAEQFIAMPPYYAMYYLPVTGVLQGKPMDRVIEDTKAGVLPLLWDNAKFWTFANIAVYNVPIKHRLLCCNMTTLAWTGYLSLYTNSKELVEAAGDDVDSERATMSACSPSPAAEISNNNKKGKATRQ